MYYIVYMQVFDGNILPEGIPTAACCNHTPTPGPSKDKARGTFQLGEVRSVLVLASLRFGRRSPSTCCWRRPTTHWGKQSLTPWSVAWQSSDGVEKVVGGHRCHSSKSGSMGWNFRWFIMVLHLSFFWRVLSGFSRDPSVSLRSDLYNMSRKCGDRCCDLTPMFDPKSHGGLGRYEGHRSFSAPVVV